MDALTGDRLHEHPAPLTCAVAYRVDDGWQAVVGTRTGQGLLFEIADDGRVTQRRAISLHGSAVKSLAVQGERIFSVCSDTSAAWFRTDDLRETARRECAHDRAATACAALRDGCFVSVGRDLKMRVWNRGAIPQEVETPHDRAIECVCTSADGRLVASGSHDGVVAIYDTREAAWRSARRLTTAGISSICFDPVRKNFVAGSDDGRTYEVPAPMG